MFRNEYDDHLFFAACRRGTIPIHNGTRQFAQGDPQEVHIRRDLVVQAVKRKRVDVHTFHFSNLMDACKLNSEFQ